MLELGAKVAYRPAPALRLGPGKKAIAGVRRSAMLAIRWVLNSALGFMPSRGRWHKEKVSPMHGKGYATASKPGKSSRANETSPPRYFWCSRPTCSVTVTASQLVSSSHISWNLALALIRSKVARFI